MNKQIIVPIVLILLIGFISAITIDQLYPTTSPFITTNSSVNIEYNFTNDNLQELIWNWDGTNYTLYDNSLVLMMNFDNRSALGENDTHVKDLSMYGNNGTVVGGSNITWTEDGKYGGAYNFSGNLSYITVPDSTNLDFNTTTISFWIKTNKISQDVIRKWTSGTAKSFEFEIGSTGLISIRITSNGTNSGSTVTFLSSISAVNDNNWHFITYRYDLSNNYLYIDNILESSNSWTKGIYYSSTPLIIGGQFVQTNYFNGSIDNLMIFNKSLSIENISELYNLQLTKYNSTNWVLSLNETNLNGFTSDYYICSSNSTNEICSDTKQINHQIILNTDFTNLIGNINNNFYGVTNYKKFFSENGVVIGASYNDFNWNRQTFSNSNMGVAKQRAYMNVLFKNSTSLFDTTVNDTAGLKAIADEVKWAYDNGITSLINIVGMPEYLQNRTSGYCNSTAQGGNMPSWATCPPKNLSASNDMIIYLLNNITNYGQYTNVEIELGNEIYHLDFWCNNLSYDNVQRGLIYVPFFNSTYNAIKSNSNLSYIKVIGMSGFRNAPNLTTTFLSNQTVFDGISIHPYGDYDYNFLEQQVDISNLLSQCSTYGRNCSYIVLSEWNIGTINLKNTSSRFNEMSNSWANSYQSILNNYPSNISSLIWDWSESSAYSGGDQYWEIVVQPELVDVNYPQFKSGYNITKNFATYCPANAEVYISSSTDDEIKTVTCKDDDNYNIILINTGTESKNVTINDLPSKSNSRLLNIKTNVGYDLSDEINIGLMDGYEIIYLTRNQCDSGYLLSDDGTTCVITGKENACSSSINAFASYVALLGLVGTLIFFGWLMAYLLGMVDKTAFHNVNMIGVVTMLILIGILLIMAIFILSTICATF